MRFSTPDGITIEFAGGVLDGPDEFRDAVFDRVRASYPSGWNYWGEIPASLDDEWSAYMTIGAELRESYGLANWEIDVDPVPERPGGYMEEGPLRVGEYFDAAEYAADKAEDEDEA